MKINFFKRDPGYGIIYADYDAAGEHHTAVVWQQSGQHHVCTGAKIPGNLVRHQFSHTQEEAFEQFRRGNAMRVDYMEGLE